MHVVHVIKLMTIGDQKGRRDTYLCVPLVSDTYLGPKETKKDVNC